MSLNLKKQKAYSELGNDIFNYEDLHEILFMLVDYNENIRDGDIITIQEGYKEAIDIGNLFNVYDLIEKAQEYAYEECGEIAEDYLSESELPKEKIDELEKLILEWVKRNKLEPNFFKVVNVVEKKYKIYDINGNNFKYEEV